MNDPLQPSDQNMLLKLSEKYASYHFTRILFKKDTHLGEFIKV